MTDPAAPEAPPPQTSQEPKIAKPSTIVVVVMAIVGIVGVLLILAAWKLPPFDSPVVATNDANIMGRVTVLAPQVNGYVTAVMVRDYGYVRAGQALVKIDDRIYRQQVAQAKGQLDLAQANFDNNIQQIASDRAQLASDRANLMGARAELLRATLDNNRLQPLSARGSISKRESDQGLSTLRTAQANVAKAEAAVRITQEKIKADLVSREGLAAQIETARAQLRLAQVNLDNTVLYAPHDGQISDLQARAGQYVAAGTQIVYFVPHDIWVIANYKETLTRGMRVGQPVAIDVDALGGARLRGHIEVFSPATGSQFSVLKPDNATGNFTKIVQRLPVRIRIDPSQPGMERLRPGLSVTTHVDTVSGVHANRCYEDDPDRPGRSRDVGARKDGRCERGA